MQTTSPPLAELKEIAREVCLACLKGDGYRAIAESVPAPDICFRELRRIGSKFAEDWVSRLAVHGFESADVGRCVLVRAALIALDQVEAQPVSDRVKRLLLEDFAKYADPPARWLRMFAPDTVRYREMAKLATFQRFPAGQFQWETILFPRRFVLDAGLPGGLKLAACLSRIGWRGPMWEIHLNDRRPNSFLLSEKAAQKSYLRMARSIALQPEVTAITVGSWLYSRELARASPHLAWLRRHFEQNGATLADLGFALQDSGFLTGDVNRKALYESGAFRPRVAIAIWPRTAVLDWASRHSELED